MLGSREHYAPPRALHRRGLLHCLYTDLWISCGRFAVANMPGAMKRIQSRFHEEIPSDRVTAFNAAGLMDLLCFESVKRSGPIERESFFCEQGKRFAERVWKHMLCDRPKRIPDVFFGFSSTCLETFEALKDTCVLVLDQFDAAEEHAAIVSAEHRKYPGWGLNPSPRLSEKMLLRLNRERDLADVVFVNSEWTRTAMVKCGVSPDKIAVGPLAYEPTGQSGQKYPVSQNRPLRVLFVGTASLGKRIQYLMEAASRLNADHLEFLVAGAIEISMKARDKAPSNMRFCGHLPKADVIRRYLEADVFVFPTLSDGFGIAQIEAMAHGLPVIATQNCGDVVTDGEDGLVIEARNAGALTAALVRLEQNRDEVQRMSLAALKKAGKFTLDHYADKLISGVEAALTTRR